MEAYRVILNCYLLAELVEQELWVLELMRGCGGKQISLSIVSSSVGITRFLPYLLFGSFLTLISPMLSLIGSDVLGIGLNTGTRDILPS